MLNLAQIEGKGKRKGFSGVQDNACIPKRYKDCDYISMVFTQYMMISSLRRLNTDKHSIGELFLSMLEEIKDVAFENALELFIDKVCQSEPHLQERLFAMAEFSSTTYRK